ncbi:MAG TPA: NAD(P)H-dependent oxidoreductase [Roseiarcus sp.]|nr:NAD(P)H-dependent oxidoreductase [Roseiarcus sp.]
MRILVVFAHPLETSFVSALHARVVGVLRAGGHSVDDLDLHAEKFDPVMSREGLLHYVDTSANTRGLEGYVQRLRAAEALILVFPVWFDGLPAIMQGYFQRVFVPGVATCIDEAGLFHPNLQHITRMAAVCAYGESRRAVSAKGDPPRRFVRDNIRALIDPKGRFEYFALYDMNFTAAHRRAAFLRRVTRAFERW